MSLHAAIQAAQSGLNVGQAGIQLTSNNIANASTPGYSRRLMQLQSIRGGSAGAVGSIGRGVGVANIRREVSDSLQARLWLGYADYGASERVASVMTQIEGSLNELSDFDVSSELSAFFGSWSERANLSESSSVVIQQGAELATFLRRVRSDLGEVREQIDRELGQTVQRADELLGTIADLNREVASAERGNGEAHELRDQRDQAVSELSELVDLSVVEQADGQYDVLIGSNPAVLGATSRGLELRLVSQDGGTEAVIALGEDGDRLRLSGGKIGGLLDARASGADDTIAALDDLAGQLIFEVNRLHSTGSPRGGYGQLTGTLTLESEDWTRALNDPTNGSLAGLPYGAENGGFFVRVHNEHTGTSERVRIDVDLDGITDSGAAGFSDDTSLEDIRAALDAVSGMTATILPDGRLDLSGEAGFSVSFEEDSSGVLATLGMNSFFVGQSAQDIAVRGELEGSASLLASGRWVDGAYVENGTALEIADLASEAVDALGGRGFAEAWGDQVQVVAGRASRAVSEAEATLIVRENLDAQRAAVSGVSLDEESVNLMNYQRQYQGAARVIQIADELLDTLIALV